MKVFAQLLCVTVLAAARFASAQPANAPNEWPMLAHDIRRSGGTAEEIRPPVKRAWVRHFHLEGILSSVQPTITGGRVYLGTLGGTFYCIDAATGRDIWTAHVGGPITHAACVSDAGFVVFGAGDGKIYALRSADGTIAWSHQSGAALWNSPLPYDGRIYIGGRDGIF